MSVASPARERTSPSSPWARSSPTRSGRRTSWRERASSVEVVDPRTLVPLDTELIAKSVAKTHRLVVAHEAVQFCGFGSEIAAHAAEHCFWDLDAPVIRVGAASHPIPYQKDLEVATLPGPAEIMAAVRSLASG